MDNNEGLPFEIAIEKAKAELSKSVFEISKIYSIPSSIMTLIHQEVLNEIKLNTYGTILAYYDDSNLSQPDQKSNEQVMKNGDD